MAVACDSAVSASSSKPHFGFDMRTPIQTFHTRHYLRAIGVPDLPPLTSPIDPGYDPATLEGHLEQSHHLMAILKISMACWLVADEEVTRRKIAAARRHGVPTV